MTMTTIDTNKVFKPVKIYRHAIRTTIKKLKSVEPKDSHERKQLDDILMTLESMLRLPDEELSSKFDLSSIIKDIDNLTNILVKSGGNDDDN